MSSQTETSARPKKILVVEDNPINQKMTCAALRELGFEPEVAINGEDAAVRGKTGDYDLILMDIHMPVLDGIASARRIREHESGRGLRTPIIAMTALSENRYHEQVHEAGMDGYLEKPFELHQLKYLLNEHLNSATGEGAKAQKDYYFADIFDRQHLLERCMGDAAMAQHLLRAFLHEAPEYIASLQRVIEREDYDRCTYFLYKLRGAAGNICAGEMFHKTTDLARSIAVQDKETLLKGIEELRRSFERFEKEAESGPTFRERSSSAASSPSLS